jgi:hypothetical protein
MDSCWWYPHGRKITIFPATLKSLLNKQWQLFPTQQIQMLEYVWFTLQYSDGKWPNCRWFTYYFESAFP